MSVILRIQVQLVAGVNNKDNEINIAMEVTVTATTSTTSWNC